MFVNKQNVIRSIDAALLEAGPDKLNPREAIKQSLVLEPQNNGTVRFGVEARIFDQGGYEGELAMRASYSGTFNPSTGRAKLDAKMNSGGVAK